MGLIQEPEFNERELAARRELFAVLAHEFRSPLGAILGFEELLSEEIFGPLPDEARDALGRIRSSAHQLLDMAAGLNDLAGSSGEEPMLHHVAVDVPALLTEVVDAVQQDASGRDTRVELQEASEPASIHTDPERARRAIRLALMAAVKSTIGGRILVRAGANRGDLRLELEGTRLELERDEPEQSLNRPDGPRLTGAGLRIAMARDALAPLGGEVALQPGSGFVTLRLLLPSREPPAHD